MTQVALWMLRGSAFVSGALAAMCLAAVVFTGTFDSVDAWWQRQRKRRRDRATMAEIA